MVAINRKDTIGLDELYTEWYRCPNCNGDYIITDFKYCPICGEKIEWIEGE